jgi:hypothetical protein
VGGGGGGGGGRGGGGGGGKGLVRAAARPPRPRTWHGALANAPPPARAPPLCRQTSSGAPLAAEARRKWCDVPANIAGTEFNNE